MAKLYPYMNYISSKEAIEYYQEYFNAKLIERNPFSMEMLEGHNDIKQKIENGEIKLEDTTIHAMFSIADQMIMASDAFDENRVKAGNVNILLDFNSENESEMNELTKIFEKVKTHPETVVIMDLADQFWGGKMGILTDKYQITWMFHGQPYSKLENN